MYRGQKSEWCTWLQVDTLVTQAIILDSHVGVIPWFGTSLAADSCWSETKWGQGLHAVSINHGPWKRVHKSLVKSWRLLVWRNYTNKKLEVNWFFVLICQTRSWQTFDTWFKANLAARIGPFGLVGLKYGLWFLGCGERWKTTPKEIWSLEIY